MTKSTLNALLAGGGLLATWLAVNPNTTTPQVSSLAVTPGTSAVREVTVDDLNLQEARLREHLADMPLRPSSRDPFRFGKSRTSPVTHPVAVAPAATPPASPAPPSLSLSGIFTDKSTRTAILTGDNQLYLVKEGELAAGRYRVVAVEHDAVTLRDESGVETRLMLH